MMTGMADGRRQLIIDTDPGVDDAFALAMAARHPHVDLLGVTTVHGNVGLADTTRNALRLLALCGREDVPVAAGAERPLVYRRRVTHSEMHGSDGLSGQSGRLPERAAGLDPRGAVPLLADLIAAATGTVTLVPIGPLTNIALLLATHPWVKDKIDRIVIMGGGLAGGNVTPAAEFNIWCDPEAARRVLTEDDVDRVLVGIDVTHQCPVSEAWLAELAATGPVGAALTALTPTYLDYYTRISGQRVIIPHDSVAVAEAIEPGLVGTVDLSVDVDCTTGPGRGAILADRRPVSNAPRNVAVGHTPDADRVRELMLTHLGR